MGISSKTIGDSKYWIPVIKLTTDVIRRLAQRLQRLRRCAEGTIAFGRAVASVAPEQAAEPLGQAFDPEIQVIQRRKEAKMPCESENISKNLGGLGFDLEIWGFDCIEKKLKMWILKTKYWEFIIRREDWDVTLGNEDLTREMHSQDQDRSDNRTTQLKMWDATWQSLQVEQEGGCGQESWRCNSDGAQ